MSAGDISAHKPPYFTEQTWRSMSDHVKKRCLNVREHCVPKATGGPLVATGQLIEELKPSQALKGAAAYRSKSGPPIPPFLLPIPRVGPGNGSLYRAVDPASRERWRIDERIATEGSLKRKPAYCIDSAYRGLPEDIKRLCLNAQDYGDLTTNLVVRAADEHITLKLKPSQVPKAATENQCKTSTVKPASFLPNPEVAPGSRRSHHAQQPSFRGDLVDAKSLLLPETQAELRFCRKPPYFSDKTWRLLSDETKERYVHVGEDGNLNENTGPRTSNVQLKPTVDLKHNEASQAASTSQSTNLSGTATTTSSVRCAASTSGSSDEEDEPACPGGSCNERQTATEGDLHWKPPYFSEGTWRQLTENTKKRYVNLREERVLKGNNGLGAAHRELKARLKPAQAFWADTEKQQKPAPPSAACRRTVSSRPVENGIPGQADQHTYPKMEHDERGMTTDEAFERTRMHLPKDSFRQLSGHMNKRCVNVEEDHHPMEILGLSTDEAFARKPVHFPKDLFRQLSGHMNKRCMNVEEDHHPMENLGPPAEEQDIVELDDSQSLEADPETLNESPPSSPESVILVSWEPPRSCTPDLAEEVASQKGRRHEERFPTEEEALTVVLESKEACDADSETRSPSPPASPAFILPKEAPGSGGPDLPEEAASYEGQRDEKLGDGSGIAACAASTSGTSPADVRKSEVPSEDASLFTGSLFEVLTLGESTVKGAQLGVFTLRPLPKGLHLGPHHSVKVDGSEGGGYTWTVRRCGEFFLVDSRPQKCSNWLRSINYTPSRRRRNLVGFLSGGDIYYRTVREVDADEELLVGYSLSFAQGLLGKRRRPGASYPEVEYGVPAHSVFLACEKCGDLFSRHDYLEKHDRSRHWYRKPGTRRCSYCPYRSNRRNDLVRHVQTHARIRLFVCDTCQKSFSRLDNLKVHLRIHSGEKPFACGQCGKRFRERVHVARHENVVHHRRYPLHCPRCGAGAEDVTKLRRHTCRPQGTAGNHAAAARQQTTTGVEAPQQQGLKRGRGRPRKGEAEGASTPRPRSTTQGTGQQEGVKRRRGRPRKGEAGGASTARQRGTTEGTGQQEGVKRGRGRPRKAEAGGAPMSRSRSTTEGTGQQEGEKWGHGWPCKEAAGGVPTVVKAEIMDADAKATPIQD